MAKQKLMKSVNGKTEISEKCKGLPLAKTRYVGKRESRKSLTWKTRKFNFSVFTLSIVFALLLNASYSYAWYNNSRTYRQTISIDSLSATSNRFVIPIQNSTNCPLSWALIDNISIGTNTFYGYFNTNCNDYQYVNQTDTEEMQYLLESNTGSPTYNRNVSVSVLYNSSYIYWFPLESNSVLAQVNRLGKAPNITVFGGKVTSISSGLFGRALSFDSDTANISNGWDTDLVDNRSMTFEVWIKPYSIGTTRGIMGFNIPNYELGLGLNNLGNIRFNCYNVGSCFDISSSGGLVSANGTYYIVAKTDGARAYLYINGVNRINGTMTKILPPTNATFTIGASVSGGLAQFNGIIDNIVISKNNNLSDDDILARYSAATRMTFGTITTGGTPPTNVTNGTTTGNVTVTVNVTGISNNTFIYVALFVLCIIALLYLIR